MYLAMPDTVRRLPLDRPDLAVREYAAIVAELRHEVTGAADLEALATEAVETARAAGATLMAVVLPPDAPPALLTGTLLALPPSGDVRSFDVDSLGDSVEDLGGPDIRETIMLATGLGPALVVQRVPGPEQVRDRRPLTLQLQAFIPEPETGLMLLLTLACPAFDGWVSHQLLFGALVASAAARPAAEAPPRPAARTGDNSGTNSVDDSFEEHTYQL
ncbi:MAG: hypothetical protein ACJ72N_00145 [Labedaea sp.]